MPLVVVLLLLFSHVAAYGDQVTLAWDPSDGSGITGYRLYYGTQSDNFSSFVDVGNQTSGTITGLQEGVTYYVAVTAYDAQGAESAYSNQVDFSIQSGAAATSSQNSSGSTTADSAGSAGSTAGSLTDTGGGGGGCFIATAAFGSYEEPHVQVLRVFRDVCLATNAPGRLFVRWYYATSPPVADAIRKNEALRAGVRLALIPVIGFGYLCLTIGLGPAALFIIISLVFLAWLGRKYFLSKHRLMPRS